MNANLLRATNLVLFTKENKIAEIGYHHLCLLSANPASNDYEPVPLTESELLKLGFENFNYMLGMIGIEVNREKFILIRPHAKRDPNQKHFVLEIKHLSQPFFLEIEFVHELQNLFFDVFKKELIYTPLS